MKNLLSPSNLMAAIDHLGDNKANGTTYAGMTPIDRRTWLRTWLRKHHVSATQMSYVAAVFALLT
jgi:hypothetical protein